MDTDGSCGAAGLSALALSGLVTPAEAFSGFSNPAVITVRAMFIMSEGLARTGIAEGIGKRIAHVAGTSEVRMITLFMLVGGGLSAFMNNIGVAALLVPVAVEVARRSGVAPSRVLMPLAYDTLLGGTMTLIGTPPNLLITCPCARQGFPAWDSSSLRGSGCPSCWWARPSWRLSGATCCQAAPLVQMRPRARSAIPLAA